MRTTRFAPVAPLFATDAYKLGHIQQYGLAGTGTITGVYSNYTNRKAMDPGIDAVVHFGLQAFISKNLMDDFEPFFAANEDLVCSLYEERLAAILGPNTIGSDHIRALHRLGYLPLRFAAMPEGTLIPIKVPSFTVENTLPQFYWLTNYIETALSAGVWHPSTTATTAHGFRVQLDAAAALTGAPAGAVDFQCHDFSYRGQTCDQAAAASGAAHLLSFSGTDSLGSLDWIERYYGGDYVAVSVPACYDDQTEVLTENGFKLFIDVAGGEKVAQYHLDGSINFVLPLDRFADRYKGKMNRFTGGRYVDAMVTPNHRMVTVGQDGSPVLTEARDGLGRRSRIPVAGRAVGSDITELSALDRLEIAFQADGSRASREHRYTGTRSGTVPIRFTLKKERFRAILDELDYEYSETDQNRTGYSHFWIKCTEEFHKHFDWIPFDRISSNWAQQFIEEVSYWDGSRHVGSMQFYSADKSDADMVAAVGVLAGYRTHCSKHKDARSTRKLQHMVSCTYAADTVGTEAIVTRDEVDYDGTVYCVSVPTKMIVVRRGQDPMVCGNTEHSVMMAGIATVGEREIFSRLLNLYLDGIVSVVSDTFDLWNVMTNILPSLKEAIMARDGKLVIRPDSGDPADILCGTRSNPDAVRTRQVRHIKDAGDAAYFGALELLWHHFGGTTNEEGYKELDSHVGLIYGDSITQKRASDICNRMRRAGFASTNIVFGVGSFSYQYVTRDTFGSAVKATWVLVDGVGVDIAKDPATDPGHTKKSATGRLAVVRDEFGALTLIQKATPAMEAASLLQPVWEDGKFIVHQSFADVRATLAAAS